MQKLTPKAKKLERLKKVACFEEADRIPAVDFFWTGFYERWKEELGLPAGTDPFRYYDFDMHFAGPNHDPHIRPFEILKQNETETIVRTGFGAVVRKVHEAPMPHYFAFDTDAIEKVKAFAFDDPWDERRFFRSGDNHLSGVGDSTIVRNAPAWIDTVKALAPDFPVFGTALEANEYMTRCIGQANTLLWIGMYPDEMGRFAERIFEFEIEMINAQIKAAGSLLSGIHLAGDIAYTGGMMFSPRYWRKYYKPGLEQMVKVAHDAGLLVHFHACGDNRLILEDYVQIGMDFWHPLEAKAGQDAIELRKKLGRRLAFHGNNDVRIWARGDREEIKAYTLRKLNAAKGGGYIFGADHSVPLNVSPGIYDYILDLVRQYGTYPLQLGEHDIPDIH